MPKIPPEPKVNAFNRAHVHTSTAMDLIPGQPISEKRPNLLSLPIKIHMQLQVHNNPVTECFMGTPRENTGFQVPHLN